MSMGQPIRASPSTNLAEAAKIVGTGFNTLKSV